MPWINKFPDLKNDPRYLEPRVNELSELLAEIPNQTYITDKATKSELNALGQLRLGGTYATLTELQTAFPAGADGLFLVIADGYTYRWDGLAWVQAAQFQSTGIGDKTITSKKTTFIELSDKKINVFDKTKVTAGGYYDATTLTWKANSGVNQTEFIPVVAGDVVRIIARTTGTYQIVYKDSQGVIFTGVKQTATAGMIYSFTVPSGAVSVSSALYVADKDAFMITINQPIPSSYIAYDDEFNYTSVKLNKNIDISEQLSKPNGNYYGKYLSILGDSISTFIGWIPSGNAVFYDGTNHGVTSVDQTWWKRLLDQTGMNLCVNNSWSASRVTTTVDETSAGSMARATSLHTVENNPDVVIVYLGINDFNNEVALGSYDGTGAFPTSTTTFREAYAIMLSKILTQYKNAEVYVCTLPDCERNGATTFAETNGNGVLLADWNKAIREMADLFGLPILEMSKSGLTFYNKDVYLSDNLHPNPAGMKLLGNKAIKTIDPKADYSTL